MPIGPDDTAFEVQKRVTPAAVADPRRGSSTTWRRGPRAAASAGRGRGDPLRPPHARGRPHRLDAARPREVHDLVRAVTHPYPGRVHRRLRGQDVRLAHAACRGLAGARHVSGPGPRRGRAASTSRAATTATSSCCGSSARAANGDGCGAALLARRGSSHEGPDPRRQRLHRQRADRAHPARRRTGTSRASTSARDKIAPFLGHPRFTYLEGDIAINKEWIEYQIKKCDVVLPLVAIATPTAYVKRAARGLRARLRGEPADRQAGRALREARRLPVDLRGLRHVPGRGVRRGRARRSSTARSASSAGSTPASKQLLDRVIWAYGERRGSSSRCSARSTGSARTSTTSTRPRRARAAC